MVRVTRWWWFCYWYSARKRAQFWSSIYDGNGPPQHVKVELTSFHLQPLPLSVAPCSLYYPKRQSTQSSCSVLLDLHFWIVNLICVPLYQWKECYVWVHSMVWCIVCMCGLISNLLLKRMLDDAYLLFSHVIFVLYLRKPDKASWLSKTGKSEMSSQKLLAVLKPKRIQPVLRAELSNCQASRDVSLSWLIGCWLLHPVWVAKDRSFPSEQIIYWRSRIWWTLLNITNITFRITLFAYILLPVFFRNCYHVTVSPWTVSLFLKVFWLSTDKKTNQYF